MPFSGSGTFNRLHNWVLDRDSGVPIQALKMDQEMDGMAAGLSTCITKDGQTTTTARIPFALGLSVGNGTPGAPTYTFTPDTNTGMYLAAADQLAWSTGGTGRVLLTNSGLSPVTNDGTALGTASLQWSDLFLASGSVINFANGNYTITHSSNLVTFSLGAIFGSNVSPISNDAGALGSAGLQWADLFLATGGVINFNNGDITLTHSANILTFAGGTLAVTGFESITNSSALALTVGPTGAVSPVFAANGNGGSSGVWPIELTGNNRSILCLNTANSGTAIGFFQGATSNQVGGITFTTSATTYATSSDGRLKEDVHDLSGAGSVIAALRPVSFTWTATKERADGFVAQEVNAVYPAAVTHDPATDYWGVDFSKLVPLLVAEVQSLRERLAAAGL